MSGERVEIGNAVLLHGDCREILPGLPKHDLLLTDPPYGIGRDGHKPSTSSHGGHKGYEFMGWDDEAPPSWLFGLMHEKADNLIIWGANYYPQCLRPSMGWLVWDKGQRISLEHKLPPVDAIFAKQELVVSELMRPGGGMSRYVNADLLIVDDVAITDLPQMPRDKLCELLSERHDRHKSTFITTNKTSKQLGEFIGERMASRFERWSQWTFFTCAWDDYRGKK